jgi:chromatin modification-related protein VID21
MHFALSFGRLLCVFRRCLLSRKRKLSELYFATVGYAGATENPFADSVYREKEQAFLDANDITK